MSVRVYIEGGFAGSTKSDCRRAFRTFFEKLLPPGSFIVIASGDRRSAFKDFCAALVKHNDDYIILLVDSEEAVEKGSWQHLAERQEDKWHCPSGAKDDQVHLMVQVMESWFLADPQALADYYGQNFQLGALPRQGDIEKVAKLDVMNALHDATRRTKKGTYHKTRHAFELIERINPNLVKAASHHASQLFSVLGRETSARQV